MRERKIEPPRTEYLEAEDLAAITRLEHFIDRDEVAHGRLEGARPEHAHRIMRTWAIDEGL